MDQITEEGLRRVIGVRALALNTINVTIGAGIFGLPGIVAAHLGAASFLAYIICAVMLLVVFLCFAEIGSKVTDSGGIYSYVETAFGYYPGFLTNVLYWFGFAVIADAAIANLLVTTLAILLPPLKEPVSRAILLFVIFGGLGWLNVRGARESVKFIQVVTLTKLLPLIILIVVGIFFVKGENLVVSSWPSISTVGEASILLFFAFGGAEAALNSSGEIMNPTRTVPRGLMLGAFVVFMFYAALQFVSQGILGNELAAFKEAPLIEVASRVMGSTGGTLIVIGTAVSIYGLLSGDMLASSRLPYAAARDGLFPKVISKVHPKYATPYVAVVLHASLGFITSLAGGFEQLAVLSSAAILLIYLGIILSVIKLRKVKAPEGSFTVPGGMTIPILAIIGVLWFLSNLTLKEYLAVLIYIAFFSIVYFVMTSIKKRSTDAKNST